MLRISTQEHVAFLQGKLKVSRSAQAVVYGSGPPLVGGMIDTSNPHERVLNGIMLGKKTSTFCYETDDVLNPRRTQPKKN